MIMEPHNSEKDQFQPDDQQNALVPKGIEIYKKVQTELGETATSEDVRLAATNELITWYHQEVKGPFTDGDLNTVMNTVIAAVTMNIENE